MKRLLFAALCAAAALIAMPALAGSERFSVILGGKNVGHLNVDTAGSHSIIDYDYKDNGRGPTLKESVDVDAAGLPIAWTISGTTTFGSKVSESFKRSGRKASWVDPTGKGSATIKGAGLYVAQSGGPWATGLYARALMKQKDGAIAALPGGTLKLDKREALTIEGTEPPAEPARSPSPPTMSAASTPRRTPC